MTSPPLLVFARIDGLYCPYFRCATCGKRITDARRAIVVITPGYTGDITVVHKGACDRFPDLPWRPLAELLSQLAFNSTEGER